MVDRICIISVRYLGHNLRGGVKDEIWSFEIKLWINVFIKTLNKVYIISTNYWMQPVEYICCGFVVVLFNTG